MRVLVNAGFLDIAPTGVQRHAWEIASRLARSELRPAILAPCALTVHPAYGAAEPLLTRRGAGSGHLWQQVALPRLVGRTDLLWSPSGLGPAVVRRHVITLHDLSMWEHPEWFSRSYRLKYRLLLPRAVRHSLHVFTSSEFSKNRISQLLGYPRDRITVVPSAVSDALLGGRTAGPEARVPELPERYVLAVGSVEPRKNLRRLVEAVGTVRREMPDLKLVLVGGRSAIFADPGLAQGVAVEPGYVVELGYLPDDALAEVYRRAAVFAYPSLYEGFGIPPLEAMALGAPVVASNATSLPEVVGDAALLVDPHSADELAEAIQQIVRNEDGLAARLREAGTARVRQYSWNRSTKIVERVLGELASR